ncbi:MAG TPA: hypothetical protein P5559_03380, partial [Candidatus Limiplasma sp.]|nr:hypothetical protein [Candidatus Limiplasma sp.]
DIDELNADDNLVVIGGGSNNALIQALNGMLYIAYNDTFTGFASNEKIILEEPYASGLGAIELMPSPYNDKRAMLVLSAPQESGLALITRLVSEEEMRWNLADDAVLINARATISAYKFREQDSLAAEKPSLMTSVSQNASTIVFAMIGIAVMAILLLAVTMVLIRIRARSKQ